MAIGHGVEALPERLDVGDWLAEDVPSQLGAGAVNEEFLAVVRHGDTDVVVDLAAAPVPGRGVDVPDLDEVPERPGYRAPQQWQFDEVPTCHGRYPANDRKSESMNTADSRF